MQRVANHRFLFRRGATLYFRRAVPKDVRHAFGGKPHDVASLQTSNLAEARHALAARLSEFEQIVASARSKPDPTRHAKSLKPIKHLPSFAEVDEAVRSWLRQRELEGVPVALSRSEGPDAIAQEVEHISAGIKRAMQSRSSGPQLQTKWIAESLAERHGWVIDETSEIGEYLMRAVARAEVEWSAIVRAEVLFEPRPAPTGIFTPEHYRQDDERGERHRKHQPVSIMSLFEGYLTENTPAPATEKAWRTNLRSLIDHLGHDDAWKVEKADLVRWKDGLLAAGKSHATISKKYFAAAKTVFGWAERQDKLPSNPAATVAISIPKKRRLREQPGLTESEAKAILAAAIRAEPDARSPIRGFGRRWIPWLCAYTGARVGEIAQLRKQDVFKHEEGIWCIRITPDAGSQKANRTREVPLHPHLIEQGFLEAIKEKTGPLFYDPEEHRGGSQGNPQYKKVGERLAEWVRDLGVDDKEVQPNHGWRHRFKRVARDVRMDHEARDNIQGHAARTEGDKYGGTSMRFPYEEISKLPRYKISAR